MPKTESNPIDLGTRAADFLLPDAQGVLHRLADFDAKPALLVAFISNRCPFVVLIREQLAAFARDYAGKGLQVVAINANDHEAHPEETLARIVDRLQHQVERRQRAGLVFQRGPRGLAPSSTHSPGIHAQAAKIRF